jgi:tetratricopeptide (TPR) repeat protein
MSQAPPIQDPFVGREIEQQRYQQFLTKVSPWVMNIIGQGGIGKSTLLRHLSELTPPEALVGSLNFAAVSLRTDPLMILEELSWQLAPHCHQQQVEAFEQALRTGNERLSQSRGDMKQEIHLGDNTVFHGEGMQLNISNAFQELRREIRKQVTSAFYALILTLEREQLVLVFDTSEWLNEPEGREVGQWLLDELLPELHNRMQRNRQRCSVVIASRERLPMTAIQRQDQYFLTLPMLDRAAVDDYLSQLGMNEPEIRQQVYEITHGHSLCVSIIGTLWQERGEQHFTLADFPRLQEQFNERALLEFIQERLDQRLRSPFRELTRYGVLLPSFSLPALRAVFPELLPEQEALDRFHQLIRYPYVETRGDQHYAFHDLLRELQAVHVREQEPEAWRHYHKRALDYRAKISPSSPERYYHAVAYDEEQGIAAWWQAVQDAQVRGERENVGTLLQTVLDKTLRLMPLTQAACDFQQGRYYYYIRQMDAAFQSYERSLALYLDLGERLGEANVRKAIGDVQRFRRELDAAMENYRQSLALHRQVGDRLGEANDLKATGDIFALREEREAALEHYRQALALYRQIKNVVGEANVLRVIADTYQSQNELPTALETYNQSLALYQQIDSKLGAANILESMHKVFQALGKADEAAQCYRQALALYHQMHVNVHESRDETRLAAGTMVVDSALPRGAAAASQAATLPRDEHLAEGKVEGHAITSPEGHMEEPWLPATLPPWMQPPPDTPTHSPYPYWYQQPQQATLPQGNMVPPVSPPQQATFPRRKPSPPVSYPTDNTFPRGNNAPSLLKLGKDLLQKLAERFKLRRRP